MQPSTERMVRKKLQWIEKRPMSNCRYKICGWCMWLELFGWVSYALSLSLRGKYPIVFSQQMIRQLTDSHTNTITRPYSECTVQILNSRRKTNSKILYLCTFASTFISICALAKHWTKLNITPFFYHWSDCQARLLVEHFPNMVRMSRRMEWAKWKQ